MKYKAWFLPYMPVKRRCMTREELNETIALLIKSNNIIQVEYCQKLVNHYLLHRLVPQQRSYALNKKLKYWNMQVNIRIIELQSGIEMPFTKGRLTEILNIIETLETTCS